MFAKLDDICRRHDELTARMADPDVFSAPGEYQKLAREVASLRPLVEAWRSLQEVDRQMEETRSMLDDEDAELREMAVAELAGLEQQRDALIHEIKVLLIPRDPNDGKNVILEVRAGTGGEEATLFAADLFRMYARYAEKRGWRIEVLSQSGSDSGGLKEIIALVTGNAIFSVLKFDSGVHRVQRVPVTESQGRIHTSACTVAVLPEAEEVDLRIPERELRVDVYRSSGPGGQSVNTTDSAIRITHVPTGLVVTCQDEKSQHKNKAKAMKVLCSRLLERREAELHAERADARRAMVGSGDRSQRIRTYNFPQNRLTDHRVGLTLYSLDQVMEGDLDMVIEPVATCFQARALEAQEGSAERG